MESDMTISAIANMRHHHEDDHSLTHCHRQVELETQLCAMEIKVAALSKHLSEKDDQLSAQHKELAAMAEEIVDLNHETRNQELQLQGTHVVKEMNKDSVESPAVQFSTDLTFYENRTSAISDYKMTSPVVHIHEWPFQFRFDITFKDNKLHYVLSLDYLGDATDPSHHFYVEVKLEFVVRSDIYPFGSIHGVVTNAEKGFSIEVDTPIEATEISKCTVRSSLVVRAHISATPLARRILQAPHGDFVTWEEQSEGNCMHFRALSMLDSGLGADCEFLVGPEGNQRSFSVSKVLMARSCPVFGSMMYFDFKRTGVIKVPDVEPAVFRKLLEFVYGCKWAFASSEEAVQLYVAAHKYRMIDLVERCVEYVWPTSHDDLWEALDMATRLPNAILEEAVMEIVRGQTHRVFANKRFLRISQASLVAIVKQYHLEVDSEMEVFEAVIGWAQAKCREQFVPNDGPNLRRQLGDTVKHIRFLAMTLEEFNECQTKTKLLTLIEMYAVLQCFQDPQDTENLKLYNLSPFSHNRGN